MAKAVAKLKVVAAEEAPPVAPAEQETPAAPAAKGPKEGKERLSSVATAIRLLKELADKETELGVTSLSRRLGLAKSTVHRLATTLIAEGMLEQNPVTEKFRLGIGLFALGTLVRRRMDVSAEARPYLIEMRNKIDETVLLAVLYQSRVMHIYNLESTQAIRMRSDIGMEKPAMITAEGLAILAFRPKEEVERLLAAGKVPARTPKTVTAPQAIRDRLEQVRRLGYAIDDEESEQGMRAIAAPIRDASGQTVAAAAIAGPVQRLSKATLKRLIPEVIGTADAISRRLGYQFASYL